MYLNNNKNKINDERSAPHPLTAHHLPIHLHQLPLNFLVYRFDCRMRLVSISRQIGEHLFLEHPRVPVSRAALPQLILLPLHDKSFRIIQQDHMHLNFRVRIATASHCLQHQIVRSRRYITNSCVPRYCLWYTNLFLEFKTASIYSFLNQKPIQHKIGMKLLPNYNDCIFFNNTNPKA